MSDNFFDRLNPIDFDAALKQDKAAEEKAKYLDYLTHRVFAQNEDGAELLSIWKESLIMSPVVQEGMDSKTDGIREGMNRFIRGIILTINAVDRGDK